MRRKACRQHAPENATSKHIEDRVDDLPHRPFRPAAHRCPWREQWLNKRPFSVGDVTGEAKPSRLCRARMVVLYIRLLIPTRSRQRVGITSFRDHRTPITPAFRDGCPVGVQTRTAHESHLPSAPENRLQTGQIRTEIASSLENAPTSYSWLRIPRCHES